MVSAGFPKICGVGRYCNITSDHDDPSVHFVGSIKRTNIKGHFLLTLLSFQTCMAFLILQNMEEDTLRNVDNQTMVVLIDSNVILCSHN